tara:strand:+ start:99 stop:560 length:462 start_codon:yes stop_codon:yes gene_type:complete
MWSTLLVLVHPILAIGLLFFMWRQYQWRSKQRLLTGEELFEARESHERFGRKILPLACGIVAIGYITNMITMNGQHPWWRYLLPFHVHGAFGTMGLGLLGAVHIYGLRTVQKREDGESFHLTRTRHGRAADMVVFLAIIHGFLGMIYLLGILA